MAVVADLHVHTTRSDGSLTLSAVRDTAAARGLEAVAITDHDRLHPDLGAPLQRDGDLTVIAGIELRVEADERIDLLGYGVEPTAALREELDRLQADRVRRGDAIIERVEARLDVDLGLEATPGIGRPHIARAIEAHPAIDLDVQGAFDRLIGADGPCFVPRDVPSFERGRALLADACALVSLAHPLRYGDPQAALSLCTDLDAVERWYPYDAPVETGLVDDAIDRYDLLPTGGSDTHDDDVGAAGLTADAYRLVRRALEAGD